jgi:hypothetical protein
MIRAMTHRLAPAKVMSGGATSTQTLSLPGASQTILQVLHPFSPMDGHKGTYLMLLIAGVSPTAAQKLVKRKYRCIQEWRLRDADFQRIESNMEIMSPQYSNQARVLRAAMLDAGVVETANLVITKYLSGEQLTDGEWQLLTKVVQLRMPQLFSSGGQTEDSWMKLAKLMEPLVATKTVQVQQSREIAGVIEQTTVTMQQSGVGGEVELDMAVADALAHPQVPTPLVPSRAGASTDLAKSMAAKILAQVMKSKGNGDGDGDGDGDGNNGDGHDQGEPTIDGEFTDTTDDPN